MNLAY